MALAELAEASKPRSCGRHPKRAAATALLRKRRVRLNAKLRRLEPDLLEADLFD